jgi:acyl-CoA thioester hydrolase
MNTYDITVFLEDTDAGGIVYHARYLNFMERARTTFFYHKGVNHGQLIASKTGNFVVTHIDIRYIKPAKLGNQLSIHTNLTEIRGASIVCKQNIMHMGGKLAEATITLAFIHPETGVPLRIPESIKQHIH